MAVSEWLERETLRVEFAYHHGCHRPVPAASTPPAAAKCAVCKATYTEIL